MTNETLEIIKRRRSIRAFKPDPVPDELLQAVVEAGLYAPNAGDQAWHFTVVQNPGILGRLELLAKQAASVSPLPWLAALGKDEHFHCLYGAPALILVSCDEKCVAPETDTAAATQNLLIAAESLDLGACWGYFVTQAFHNVQAHELRKAFSIPEGYKVYTSVALGYRAEDIPDAPPRKPGLVTFIQ